MPVPPARLQEAAVLFKSGQTDRAIASLRRLVDREPTDAQASQILCSMLIATGAAPQAAFVAKRTADAAPRDPLAQITLALALAKTGQADAALEHSARARDLAPTNLRMHLALIEICELLDRANLAADAARDAWLALPDDFNALVAYTGTLIQQARVEEALDAYRTALARAGPSFQLLAAMCLPLLYSHTATREQVFQAHSGAGHLLAQHIPPDPTPFDLDPTPGRPLRIAYVSQDFRNHAGGHFIMSVIRAHDRAAFQPYLYYADPTNDDMTEEFKSLAAAFVPVDQMPDTRIAARLRADQIDIAVDLTGYSGTNGLASIARRPAPITMTYLGYLNTSGVPAIQHRLVDSITDPPGDERWSTEHLIRLEPPFLCFAMPRHTPPLDDPPCLTTPDAAITFGSFNFLCKMNPPVYDLWARILAAVPNSRLYLKSRPLEYADVRARVRDHFAAAGIDPDRLTLTGLVPSRQDHMAAYRHIDIALDPFPFNGVTTTVESLLMGVPVVTLRGNTHWGRVGASFLTAAGLPDHVAETPDDYLRIARDLASDPAHLAALRKSLRDRVLASPLCDGPAFTRRLESIFRDLWRNWCADQSAPTVEITRPAQRTPQK